MCYDRTKKHTGSKGSFAAIDQGNIEKAVRYFDENVDFQSRVLQHPPRQMNWARPRHSRAKVEAIFKERKGDLHNQHLETKDFTVKGDKVIVKCFNTGTVKATNNTSYQNWVMVMELNGGWIMRSHEY